MSAGRGAPLRTSGVALELTYPRLASAFCARSSRLAGGLVSAGEGTG